MLWNYRSLVYSCQDIFSCEATFGHVGPSRNQCAFLLRAGARMSSTTNLLTLDVSSFLSLVQERVLGQVSYKWPIAEMLHVDTIY